MRERIGDLVIENRFSGGHRLEPAMMNPDSMSSFSDARESWNLAIITRRSSISSRPASLGSGRRPIPTTRPSA